MNPQCNIKFNNITPNINNDIIELTPNFENTTTIEITQPNGSTVSRKIIDNTLRLFPNEIATINTGVIPVFDNDYTIAINDVFNIKSFYAKPNEEIIIELNNFKGHAILIDQSKPIAFARAFTKVTINTIVDKPKPTTKKTKDTTDNSTEK